MPYVKNAWYVAGWSEDIATETPVAVTILGERIVIYRTNAGRLVALEDRCVHRLAPLSLGRCEGERLRCMYHGLLFDPSGAVVEIPGQDVIPPQARVRSFPVVERHSWIWIWMGDRDRAEPALIPPAVGLDHPGWVLGRGQLEYAAEARLICDNLLDFSHLSFVHTESFGATETWARNRPKVTQLERGVRVERWIEGEMSLRDGVVRDRFSSYDFLLPGILLMSGGNFVPGTSASLGRAAPDLGEALSGVTFTSQAVTPVEEKTSLYFFSWGPRRDQGDETVRDQLMGIAAKAFAEDKTIIEAQQRVIDSTVQPRIMPTGADKALTLFSRLVDRMAAQELCDAV